MKRKDVDALEVCIGKIESFVKEIGALSKKTPNDAVNKFKLGFINSTVANGNSILGVLKPFADFDLFEDESLPSNSDVLFILAQYAEALDLYRSQHIKQNMGGWFYIIDDDGPAVRTTPPASITRKN